jgi:transcriptional regulator with XRE-family HTH domain
MLEAMTAKTDKVLKELMKKRGLSTRALAKATGVPQSTLTAMLAGRHTHKPEHLRALALHFGISIDRLLFDEDHGVVTLDNLDTEQIFSGWLRVKIERAIPDPKKDKK